MARRPNLLRLKHHINNNNHVYDYTYDDPNFKFSTLGEVKVDSLSDLPTPVGGVITLLANHTYKFTRSVDLLGSRLVGQYNTCLLGNSSENAFISSTGLDTEQPIYYCEYTTPIRHVSFINHTKGVVIDGSAQVSKPALDWFGVNFVNLDEALTVIDCDNFIFTKGAFSNCLGITFDGSAGTISFNSSIFISQDVVSGDLIKVLDGANISRRFRIIYSAIISLGGVNAINFSTSANVPVESYILDTIDFSGNSNYIIGVQEDDNKALFSNCKPIKNSTKFASYTMVNNVIPTPVVTGIPTKLLGITTPSSLTTKFDLSIPNRAIYTGAIPTLFHVEVINSVTSGNNNQIGVYVAKNDVVIANYETYDTTDGAGRATAIPVQAPVLLETNDYVEVFVENDTGPNAITGTNLNVIIKPI